MLTSGVPCVPGRITNLALMGSFWMARRHGARHPETAHQGQVRYSSRHARDPGSEHLMAKTRERIAEMRLLGDRELLERLAEIGRELFNMRFQIGRASCRER